MSPSCVRLFVSAAPGLRAWLFRCFPQACPGHVDDALGDTCVAMALAPDRHDPAVLGEAEVLRRLRVVAWRALRGTFRRHSRRDVVDVHGAEEPGAEDPLGVLEAAEALARIDNLVRAAARQYGGRNPERLCTALVERLVTADTDTAVAARIGLPRETLNRARRWVEVRLETAPHGS